jgi:D-alanyl-D-alanine carboxypeptidase/D-alanyl-D-alanine-endopeptidase (penicillin-binding protein 4)
VRSWLASKGIDSDGVVLENGSGLSRIERIRPVQLAAVLKAGLASPWAPEFAASIPIVAFETPMRKRLVETPAWKTSRIKTGTLRDVSGIAGYVTDNAGEKYIVVAMINYEPSELDVRRRILDTLLEWVANARARAGTRP